MLLVLEAAFTPWRVEPASPMENHGDFSWVGNTPRTPFSVAAFIGFAAQAKPVRFECAGASALQTLPFVFNPDNATGTQGISV